MCKPLGRSGEEAMSVGLFSPLRAGEIFTPNRIWMAPLTRSRAGSTRTPNALMGDYYAQRATAGLIITEATSIDPMGVGYSGTPGIWNDDQVLGWRSIVSRVHAAQGRIVLQLWHVGRVSDPLFLGGQTPVAPSEVGIDGFVSLVRPQRRFVVPRSLSIGEIQAVVRQYRRAAENAERAGFDGVELHAANGYLVDQFLQSSTNRRKDDYGGSVENRCRFLLEVVDQLISVWGAGRVGVHLAPSCDSHGMGDSDPRSTFGFAARELGRRKIAFIFTRESVSESYLTTHIRQEFGGVVVGNQGLSVPQAQRLIETNSVDAVAWGKLFISNPDLPRRIQTGAPLADYDSATFYTEGPKGYTDYPMSVV